VLGGAQLDRRRADAERGRELVADTAECRADVLLLEQRPGDLREARIPARADASAPPGRSPPRP
jgi:hypothetical protein